MRSEPNKLYILWVFKNNANYPSTMLGNYVKTLLQDKATIYQENTQK